MRTGMDTQRHFESNGGTARERAKLSLRGRGIGDSAQQTRRRAWRGRGHLMHEGLGGLPARQQANSAFSLSFGLSNLLVCMSRPGAGQIRGQPALCRSTEVVS